MHAGAHRNRKLVKRKVVDCGVYFMFCTMGSHRIGISIFMMGLVHFKCHGPHFTVGNNTTTLLFARSSKGWNLRDQRHSGFHFRWPIVVKHGCYLLWAGIAVRISSLQNSTKQDSAWRPDRIWDGERQPFQFILNSSPAKSDVGRCDVVGPNKKHELGLSQEMHIREWYTEHCGISAWM
jgi:hypothetical protein